MLISEKKFFENLLDTDIPALKRCAELSAVGNIEGAEEEFLKYLRSTLRPDDYFKIPYYERENAWAYSSESDFQAAERILTGKLMSCGFMYDFGSVEQIDWSLNPTYNGFKEWVWQLSRHHELRCLAKVYRDTGDEKYADGYQRLLTSWLEQAPCPENESGRATLQWRTIEAGIRMVKNWHYAVHAFLHSPTVSARTWTLTFMSLWEHGYRLSGFCTTNNWLIMELAGLAHIAVLYPFFKDSARWRKQAMEGLTAELEAQVYDDGWQFELTTNYHWVVVMNYLFVMDIHRAMGEQIPTDFYGTMKRLFAAIPTLMRPDRTLPNLNDGRCYHVPTLMKDALPYFPEEESFRYFATDGKEGREPDALDDYLANSGYAVMRTGRGREDIWVFLESAPVGYAHRHEDKLNLLLSAYGVNMLDDMGGFAYDNSAMRKYAVSTRAHNTGLVDGLEQRAGEFYRWSPEMKHELADLKVRFGDRIKIAEGRYDQTYGARHVDVVHTRRVALFTEGIALADGGSTDPIVILVDRFVSRDGEEHLCEASFQLGRVALTLSGRSARADYGNGRYLCFATNGSLTTVSGQQKPQMMGWTPNHEPGDVEHYPSPVLSIRAFGTDETLVTVLYPGKDGRAPDISLRLSDDGRTAVVSVDGAVGTVELEELVL